MESERMTGLGAGAEPNPRRIAQVLADRQEGGKGLSGYDLGDREQAELASLLLIANRLDGCMTPARPSAVFVRSLGQELVREARRQAAIRRKRHRIAVISAAVAGGVVSVASLVGGTVVLVKWLRGRDARQASTV